MIYLCGIPPIYLNRTEESILASVLSTIDLSPVIVILLETKIIWVMLHFRKQHDKLLPEVAECICIVFKRLLTILSSFLKKLYNVVDS